MCFLTSAPWFLFFFLQRDQSTCGYHRSRFEMEISLYFFYHDPVASHFPLALEAGIFKIDQLSWWVLWADLHPWVQLHIKDISRSLFRKGWLVGGCSIALMPSISQDTKHYSWASAETPTWYSGGIKFRSVRGWRSLQPSWMLFDVEEQVFLWGRTLLLSSVCLFP